MTQIRAFRADDESQVVRLWQACELIVPRNVPHLDIARKLAFQPDLFFVAERDDEIVGTAMAGYEGHRGWVNYLAVAPAFQRHGLGRRLMEFVEARLAVLGCAKINLQVRSGNAGVVEFYERLGYRVDEVVSLGKRLDGNES